MISTTFNITAQTQQSAGTPNWTDPENLIGEGDSQIASMTINSGQTSQKLRLSVTVPADKQGCRYHGCRFVPVGLASPGYDNQSGSYLFRNLSSANAEIGNTASRSLNPSVDTAFLHEKTLAGFFHNLTTAQIDTLANWGGITLQMNVVTGSGYVVNLDAVDLVVQHSAPTLTCDNTSTINMASAASGAGTGTTAWTNPNNASGEANATYATCTTTNDGVVDEMDSEELQGTITPGTLAALNMVYPKQIRIHVSGVKLNDVDGLDLSTDDVSYSALAHALIRLVMRNSDGSLISVTPMEGDIVEIPIGFTNRRTYTFTFQDQATIQMLVAALDASGKIGIKFVGSLPGDLEGAPCNFGYEVDSIQLEMGWDDQFPASAGGGGGFSQATEVAGSLLMIVDEDLLEQFSKDSKR